LDSLDLLQCKAALALRTGVSDKQTPCKIKRSMRWFGLAVRHEAGKQKDLGSVPLQLSLLFKKVMVCGHSLVTLSLTVTVNETLKWLSPLPILMQESFWL